MFCVQRIHYMVRLELENWGEKGLRIFQPAALYSMINNDFSGCPQACPAGKTTTGGPSSHLVRALTDPDKWCTESCPGKS